MGVCGRPQTAAPAAPAPTCPAARRPRDRAQPELQPLPDALPRRVGPQGPRRAPGGVRQVRRMPTLHLRMPPTAAPSLWAAPLRAVPSVAALLSGRARPACCECAPGLPHICRYISEDFGGVALHPVDLLDAATGAGEGEAGRVGWGALGALTQGCSRAVRPLMQRMRAAALFGCLMTAHAG